MVLAKIKEYFKDGNTSKLEKKLVRKLDFFIMTFCCMAYFMNYLDRANLAQAYVSGMKEELNFKGNQLTVINTIYSVGYLVGIVPNNALLSKFRPRIFFPIMMVIWASFTICSAAAKRPQHLMVIRLFQGYAESCIFAGTHYILGSWYTEKELGKRSGIFTSSGIAGGMFGGFLQSGIYKSMNGLGGLSGWRWLFIIDGIITLPVAVYGFFLFPDTPSTTTAPYFSAEEKELAKARVPTIPSEPILTVSFLKRVVTSWYFYSFGLLWIITNCSEAASSNNLLTLYMKSSPNKTYSVYQLNNYPTGVQAMGIVSTLLWATFTDIFGRRWMAGYYIAATGIVSSAIILAPSTTEAGIFGAYYWAGTIYACQATFFAWANDTMRNEEDSFRAIIIGSMNFGGNMMNVFWPLIFYAADMAPYFTRGMYAMIGVCLCLAIWVTIMVSVERKQKVIVIDAFADDESEDVQVQGLDHSQVDKGISKV